MDIDRLRQTIIGAVSGPQAQKIRFHCGSRTVNGHIFNLVVDRLRKKKIHIQVDPDELGDAAEAMYLPDFHTFIFRTPFFGETDSEQAVIVHESVHAGFDVLGDGGHFKRIDNEPSAYLAESFFLLNSGFSFNEIRDVLPLRLAFTIALKMQSKNQSSVSPDDLLLLRNGVARTQITIFGTDTKKGTDGDLYRGIAP
jgi:hypothetical protein